METQESGKLITGFTVHCGRGPAEFASKDQAKEALVGSITAADISDASASGKTVLTGTPEQALTDIGAAPRFQSARRIHANTLVNACVGDREWAYLQSPNNSIKSRIPFYSYDNTYGPLHYLNPTGSSVSAGWAAYRFVAPATGTATFVMTAKRATTSGTFISRNKITTSTITTGLDDKQTVWNDNTWRTITLTASVTAGVEYYALINVLDTPGYDSKLLVADVAVTCSGTSETILDAPYQRVTFRPGDVHSGITIYQDNRHLKTTSGAKFRIETDAESMVLEAFSNIYDIVGGPPVSNIGVMVNGEYYSNVAMTAGSGSLKHYQITLPSGRKIVELVNGIQSYQSSTVYGSWVRAVYVPLSSNINVLEGDSKKRLVIIGDSISSGSNAANPCQAAWGKVAATGMIETLNLSRGYDTLFGFSSATAVSQMRTFGPTHIWLALGTNDYVLKTQNASAFETMYGTVLDAIHAAYPSTVIYTQTPLEITATVASPLSTIAEYRTAISNAVSTRAAWATFVSGPDLMPSAFLDTDGLHPTVIGQGIIGDSILGLLGL